MRQLSSKCETVKLLSVQSVCSLSVQSVYSLSVQSVSSLPVQSVSSLDSLFLFVQSVSSLSVQSVSSLCSLFPLCTIVFLFVQSVSLCLCNLFRFVCAVCFLLCHNGDAEQTTATSTHCLRHCMQRFSKFLSFLTLSLRNKRCGRLLRQSVRNKSKFGKRP